MPPLLYWLLFVFVEKPFGSQLQALSHLQLLLFILIFSCKRFQVLCTLGLVAGVISKYLVGKIRGSVQQTFAVVSAFRVVVFGTEATFVANVCEVGVVNSHRLR